jgi:hypothetical protein
MLKSPTRITRMIMDITRERFIADRIFASGGGVTGGAVVYDQAQANEMYLGRDVEQIAVGSEFPLVTSDQLAPQTALVEKWGGKTFIFDEARDRNDTVGFVKVIRQLANTAIYGPAISSPAMPEFYSSPRVLPGTAYVIEAGQVGQMRIEKPLYTTTWREEKVERTWTQSGVRPLWFVDDLFRILKFVGLAG